MEIQKRVNGISGSSVRACLEIRTTDVWASRLTSKNKAKPRLIRFFFHNPCAIADCDLTMKKFVQLSSVSARQWMFSLCLSVWQIQVAINIERQPTKSVYRDSRRLPRLAVSAAFVLWFLKITFSLHRGPECRRSKLWLSAASRACQPEYVAFAPLLFYLRHNLLIELGHRFLLIANQ